MAKYLDYTGLSTVWARIKAYVTAKIEGLDSSVSATAADGNQYSVLTGVTETDGKLTSKTEVKLAAAAKTGAAADVSIADSGNYYTGTSVETALQEVGAALGSGGSVATQILTAINALDAEKTSNDGINVLVKVTEADGKITAVNITTDNTINSTDLSTAIGNLDGNAAVSSSGASAASGVTKTSYGYVLNKVNEVDGVVQAVGSGDSNSKQVAVDLAGAANAAYNDAANLVSTTINGLDGAANATGTASAISNPTKTSYVYVLNKVDEVDGKVKAVGSGSTLTAVDAAGAANAAYTDACNTVIGADTDASTANTVYGAKAYADSLFGSVTSITYSVVTTLPSTGAVGTIYLVEGYNYTQIEPGEQTPPVTNPSAAGYYVKNSDGTYSLTTDTSVVAGHVYYVRSTAYDEYIWISTTSSYERLGNASLDLGDYLEKSANITTDDINHITTWTGSAFTTL